MRREVNFESGVYKYLQSLGILHEVPEVIALAKRTYWNQVKRQWKKDRAKTEKAFTVSFTPQELREIIEASAMHNMSRSRFIKQACLAYVHKKYLIPNTESLQNIKSLLSLNYSALQEMYEGEKVPPEVAIELLLRMELLERHVLNELVHPKLVSNGD